MIEAMRLTIIESPYAGTKGEPESVQAIERERNVAYARACMRDSVLRGEAPFASHLLYTQPGVLDDAKPEERALGIQCGFAIAEAMNITGRLRVLSVRAVYMDLGQSHGMEEGIKHARGIGQPIDHRTLGEVWTESHAARAFALRIESAAAWRTTMSDHGEPR